MNLGPMRTLNTLDGKPRHDILTFFVFNMSLMIMNNLSDKWKTPLIPNIYRIILPCPYLVKIYPCMFGTEKNNKDQVEQFMSIYEDIIG